MLSILTDLSLNINLCISIAKPILIGINGVNGPNQKAYIVIPIPFSQLFLMIKPNMIRPDPLIINQTINKLRTPRQLPIDFTTAQIPFQNAFINLNRYNL